MTKRPKVLFTVAIPLLIAGIVLTVAKGTVNPLLTLLFPCGVFLLGLAGISYVTHPEFEKFDTEQDLKGFSPGDQNQHILRPEEEPYHTHLAHAH